MLDAGDLLKMRADLAEIIGDNSSSIVLLRHGATRPAQTVRVEQRGRQGSRRLETPSAEESRSSIVVAGDTTLDIQKDDTFTLNGQLYRVVFVRPNTQMGVQAEAELVQ